MASLIRHPSRPLASFRLRPPWPWSVRQYGASLSSDIRFYNITLISIRIESSAHNLPLEVCITIVSSLPTMSSKPSTPRVPRGLRVLKKSTASSTDNNVQAERSALMKEIAQIEQWWHDPRWKGTTRPYSGKIMICIMMSCIRLFIHLSSTLTAFLINILRTAADVASLRPSTAARSSGIMSPKCSYSNTSSRKLYSLLSSLHSAGGYSHTFGALDPVQVVQMAPRKCSMYGNRLIRF